MGKINDFLGKFVNESIDVNYFGSGNRHISHNLIVPKIIAPIYKINRSDDWDNFNCMVDQLDAEELVYGDDYEY